MKKLALSVIIFLSPVAFADCSYNGVLYPTGTVISGLTCQSNGTWK